MKRIVAWILQTVLPPLSLFLMITVVWQAAVVVYQIKPYLLPSPLAVGAPPIGRVNVRNQIY